MKTLVLSIDISACHEEIGFDRNEMEAQSRSRPFQRRSVAFPNNRMNDAVNKGLNHRTICGD
jgi:hypothetical protein